MIYFARALDRPIVKIGHTMAGIAHYMKALRNRYGHNVAFVALAPGGPKEEAAEHKRFEKHWVNSEWFLWCDEIAARVQELRENHPDFDDQVEYSMKLAERVAVQGPVTVAHRLLDNDGKQFLLLDAPPSEQAKPSLRSSAPPEGELRNRLAKHKGNVAAVGRIYNKERMQVHRWMKHYKIDVRQYR